MYPKWKSMFQNHRLRNSAMPYRFQEPPTGITQSQDGRSEIVFLSCWLLPYRLEIFQRGRLMLALMNDVLWSLDIASLTFYLDLLKTRVLLVIQRGTPAIPSVC